MPDTSYDIPPMPPPHMWDTVPILKALTEAKSLLAELKGTAYTLPNQQILIDTLFLQEALASSEIENIVTTQDEVFRTNLVKEEISVEAKEVSRYREAMHKGYTAWQEKNHISEIMLVSMFQVLKQRDDGYRTTHGTKLLNDKTQEVIYTPPQDLRSIESYMGELVQFINTDDSSTLDPLIKMALIHHQFESIHPFSDGNGRVGRMLNVLYLTHAGLLDAPILYLSRAINATKPDYYRLLQEVREKEAWQEWVIYILQAVAETARSTLHLVKGIRELMQDTKQRLRSDLPKIYSQDLLNSLFRHPYTRISYVEHDLDVSYITARKYLKILTTHNFIEEISIGRTNYYTNTPLLKLLAETA